jgi:hypothetical protein
VRRASSLIRWRPSHGGPLWRATQWLQANKHRPMREPPGRSANSSRWSSRTNGSLGGSRLRLPPRVWRAWLSSLIEVPNGSRNAFRWKISRGSEIIYKRIRNYASPRSKERRCGKIDSGGRGKLTARHGAPCGGRPYGLKKPAWTPACHRAGGDERPPASPSVAVPDPTCPIIVTHVCGSVLASSQRG